MMNLGCSLENEYTAAEKRTSVSRVARSMDGIDIDPYSYTRTCR